MIEKPKRPKKIPNQDNKQPQTIEQLIKRYDLDNTKIYNFLDELVLEINKNINKYSNLETEVIDSWYNGQSLKFKDNNYLDTKGIVYNKDILNDILERMNKYNLSKVTTPLNYDTNFKFFSYLNIRYNL